MLHGEEMRGVHWISIVKGIGDHGKTLWMKLSLQKPFYRGMNFTFQRTVAYDGKTRCVTMELRGWTGLEKQIVGTEGAGWAFSHGHWCQGSNSCDPGAQVFSEWWRVVGSSVDDSEKRHRGKWSWMTWKPKGQGFLLKGGEAMVLKWYWGVRRLLTPLHGGHRYE